MEKNKDSEFVNICPVFLSENIETTVNYYTEKLGFKYAKHYGKKTRFAAIYRDSIEIIVVQKKFGEVIPNILRYGEGYDAYINTGTVEGVDEVYEEYKSKKVKIIKELNITDYGSYEFVIEDIDGRQIGIGRIKSNKTFFRESNYLREKSNNQGQE